MTQSEFAERMRVHGFAWDKSQVSRLESGRMVVDPDKLVAVATVLGVTTDRLLRDPNDLDSAIFDRLLGRWVSLFQHHAENDVRMQVIFVEIEALMEQSPSLRTRFDAQILTMMRWKVCAQSEGIDFGAPEYGEYLESLLVGPEVEWAPVDDEEESTAAAEALLETIKKERD